MTIKTKLILLFLLSITVSIALISWRGIKYFSMDKETYVQDLNAQNIMVLSGSLSDRISTYRKLMETFADMVDYNFSTVEAKKKAQNDLLQKFPGFVSVAVFKANGRSLSELFRAYNPEAMKVAKLAKDKLEDKKSLSELYGSLTPSKLYFKDFTRDFSSPTILMALKQKGNVFIVAWLPQKLLLNIIGEKEIFTAYVVDDHGNLVMHQNPKALATARSLKGHPMVVEFLKDKERRTSGMTKEYFDDVSKKNMLGAWAHVGSSGLGLFIETEKDLAYVAARALIKRLSVWVLVIFALAVLVTILFSSTITKPLQALSDVAKKVGKGDFNVDIKATTKDEIGDLVGVFAKMSDELKERDKKIESANKQLVQSEKMGAFGQMSAGIAHEVKNPLAGILGYAQLAKKKAGEESGLLNYLQIIEKETKRCKEIVENLMRFARSEKAEFENIPFYQAVKDAVALVDHQISISGIKIDRKFPSDEDVGPLVNGNANQLTQVFTNIMLNAQYAMKKKGDGGTLTVELLPVENGKARVVIQDTGTGIEAENIPKLFDPFFTTKPAGEGTGLGLSVTFGIIKDHKGEIKVESEYGEWTKFIISLPIKS